MNALRSLLVLLPFALLSGCELLQPVDDPADPKVAELDRRMQAVERVVQNQSLVKLTQQVAALERRNDELQGRMDTQEHSSTTTADRQRQLYADLDARIQSLEAAVQARRAVSVMEGGTLSPGQLPVPGGSDRANYQAAFELLKQQRYEPAAIAFKQFLVAYPDSELADNAQYWLAESYYVTQEFDEALAAFEIVINKYARSRKVPDALLKIGYCNYELKRFGEAREALELVQTEFKDTTAARLAGQRLTRMEEEGA